MPQTIIVATDGSALGNPNGPAGWAWVVDKKRWNRGGFPKASNIVAEMYAILMALTQIPLEYDIHIQTDSDFCLKLLGDGTKKGRIHSWKPRAGKPGWTKADGKEPANLKLVQALDEALTRRLQRGKVRIEWVKAHADHPLNTVADKLCTSVSGAIKDGKKAPVGPGWSEEPGESFGTSVASTGRTAAPRASAPVRRTSTSGKLALPSQARRTVPTTTLRPHSPVASSNVRSGASFTVSRQKSVDAPAKPTRPRFEPEVLTCSSCNGKINPYTQECRCSI